MQSSLHMWKETMRRYICNILMIVEKFILSVSKKVRHTQDVSLTHLKTGRHMETHTHTHTYINTLVDWNVQTSPPTQTYACSFKETAKHTHTHAHTHVHTHRDHAASPTREYDDSVMTPTTSRCSFTLLSSFSQPFSLAVHITLPDSRGERKGGWEEGKESWRGGMRNYKEGVQ